MAIDNERLEDLAGTDSEARAVLENRWRGDAQIVLQFAGALLVSGQASDVLDAVATARDAWFSLLADRAFGQAAIASPNTPAVEALRLQLPPDRGEG